MIVPKLNTHRITISCEEDLLTLHYFVELADKYLAAMSFPEPDNFYNKEDIVMGKKALEIIPRIVAVNGMAAYVILDDNTIRVTDKASSHVASCDECDVSELCIY